MSAEALRSYTRAAARYRAGDYVAAIELTKATLKEADVTPALRRNAWFVMGVSYCMLRSHPGAERAYRELGTADRAEVALVCARRGVTLP